MKPLYVLLPVLALQLLARPASGDGRNWATSDASAGSYMVAFDQLPQQQQQQQQHQSSHHLEESIVNGNKNGPASDSKQGIEANQVFSSLQANNHVDFGASESLFSGTNNTPSPALQEHPAQQQPTPAQSKPQPQQPQFQQQQQQQQPAKVETKASQPQVAEQSPQQPNVKLQPQQQTAQLRQLIEQAAQQSEASQIVVQAQPAPQLHPPQVQQQQQIRPQPQPQQQPQQQQQNLPQYQPAQQNVIQQQQQHQIQQQQQQQQTLQPRAQQPAPAPQPPAANSYNPAHYHPSSPLYIGHNPFIEILRPHSYADDNIVTLNLSHSHIYEIDGDAFVGQRFEHIDLSNNKLGLIHSRSFRIGPTHSRHHPYDPHASSNGTHSASKAGAYPTRRPPPAHPKNVIIDFSHNPAIVALSGAFDHIDVPNCLLNFTNTTVELKFGAFKKYFKEHPGHIIDADSVDCCEQEWLLSYKHNFVSRTYCAHDPTLFLSKVPQQAIIDSCIAHVTSGRGSMTIQEPGRIQQMAIAPRGHSGGHSESQNNKTYLILGGTAMVLTSLSIYIIFYMFSLKAALVVQIQQKG